MSTSATTQQATTTTSATVNPAQEALNHIGAAITSLEDTQGGGTFPGIRQGIYRLVQAQRNNTDEGAFYNELQCPLHIGLIGTAGLPGTGNEPITVSCGHTFCRGCIAQAYTADPQHRCPTCRTPIQNPTGLARNHAIHSLLVRLTPPQQGHHGGKRRKRKTTRKNKKY